jgi:PAS domain S-box-containing protein
MSNSKLPGRRPLRDDADNDAHQANDNDARDVSRGLVGLLRHTLSAIVRSATREQLLQEVCRAAVEQDGFAMAWVGWADPESRLLVPIAQCGDGVQYLHGTHLPCDERPAGSDPAGIAYSTGRAQICNDLQADPAMHLWRQRAHAHGFRSVATVPLRRHGSAGGVLVLNSAEPGYFRSDAYAQLEELGAGIGFALETLLRESGQLELVAAANRYFTLAEASKDAIIGHSLDGKITSWNPAAEKMFGYHAAEALGLDVSMLSPEDRPLEARYIDACSARAERIDDFEAFRVGKNGQAFKVALRVAPVRSGTGSVVGALTILRALTDRQITREHLRAFQTQFDTMFHNLDEGLLIADTEGNILLWNAALADMFGMQATDIFPRRVGDLSPLFELSTLEGAPLPIEARPLARVLRGERLSNVEVRVRRLESDAQRIFSYSGSTTLNSLGRGLGFVTIKDVTERHRSAQTIQESNAHLERRVLQRTTELAGEKDRAETADRLKSVFLTTMSHELRTPLNAIIGFCGLLLQQMAGPINQEQSSQLELVNSSARHLLALINDILDMSKIEAGQLEVSAEYYDLDASMESVIAIVRPLAEKKGLRLRGDFRRSSRFVVSDRRRVEQVLLNLLSNAIKFTDAGEVTLTSDIVTVAAPSKEQAPLSQVRLRVSDTGIGIHPQDLAGLFQPFRQIDTATRRREGTGLGLAICRRLADLLGGQVHVESELGRGSVFTLTLPINQTLSIQ